MRMMIDIGDGKLPLLLALLLILLLLAAALFFLLRERRALIRIQQITIDLQSNIKRKQLLDTIMHATAALLRAEGSSVLLLDEKTGELYFEVATGEKNKQIKQIRLQPGEGIAGYTAQSGQSVLIQNVSQDSRWSGKVSQKVQIPTRNMICVPVQSAGKILGVLQVINKREGRRFTKRDLRMLEMTAVPAAVALENMHLYEALAESAEHLRLTAAAKERMEGELAIAKQIQQSFLPKHKWKVAAASLYASLVPAREVGGDFYYYTELADGKLFFCIGDVSDKGMPAALFLSGLMIALKAKLRRYNSPGTVLQELNEEMYSEDSAMFATVFAGCLDLHSGQLIYCNAGHCPPYFIAADRVEELQGARNLPIGVAEQVQYVENVAQITENGLLFFYTDGITEAASPADHWFGRDRLERLLYYNRQETPERMTAAVLQEAANFSGDRPQTDDIAVMTIGYRGY